MGFFYKYFPKVLYTTYFSYISYSFYYSIKNGKITFDIDKFDRCKK